MTSLQLLSNNDGIELIVNPETKDIFYPGCKALARVCSIGLEKPIQVTQVQRTLESGLKGVTENQFIKADILTGGGIQGVTLIPLSEGIKVIRKYNPKLYHTMAIAGEAVYLLKLVGYEIKVNPPSQTDIQQPKTQAELSLMLAQQLVEQERQLNEVKSEIKEIKANVEQAEALLKALPAPSTDIPEISVRMQINRLVRDYVVASNVDYQFAWNMVYRQFRDTYGIDLSKRANNRKISKLDMCEQLEMLDQLYAIAYALLTRC